MGFGRVLKQSISAARYFVKGREGSGDQGTAQVRVFLVWLHQKGQLCCKRAESDRGAWSECESQEQWDTLSLLWMDRPA